ncbi:hrp65 protein-like [Schistocerca cancellata]|uniref:hrp65 protein-like n=1 Tax=Schistocerca cancellata TaxID=274614 RepID=UPI0021176F6C|nr:hrp65 protein-like [Schistocerca cancellata]
MENAANEMNIKNEEEHDRKGQNHAGQNNHPGGGRGEGRGNFDGRGGGFGGGRGRFANRPRDDNRGRNPDDRLNERLAALMAPTHDLPPMDTTEKKFSGRCRLYIGNLTADVTDDEIREMFSPYGEVAEQFVNKEKNFAFIRMDYRANAEKAKRELDGSLRKGRSIKVRFAPPGAAIKVKNLTPWVSNELLEKAFSVFGDIERAVVIVDDRGKSMEEGIVEFARKPAAQMAMRRCAEGCFFLTASLRPVVIEPFEPLDDTDGYQEKNLPKKNPEYYKMREVGPRFATPGSFEYEYGTRWKQLYDLHKQKEDSLRREMKMEEEKLEAQMEYARYEHETEMLREQLRQRELDRERQKQEWEMKERQVEEQRLQMEERMRRQQEEMQHRMHHQEEELRRRQQENNLFMQAHQLNSLLEQQEQALRANPTDYDAAAADPVIRDYDAVGAEAGTIPPDPKAFMDAYDRGASRYGEGARGDLREDLGGPAAGSRSRWGPGGADRRGGDYPSKRRRY